MTSALLYTLVGVALFVVAGYAFLVRGHLVRRIVAINVMGGGVFLVFGGMGAREGAIDPVPQALVITGIVVAVAMTALALALLLRLYRETGAVTLDPPAEARGRGEG